MSSTVNCWSLLLLLFLFLCASQRFHSGATATATKTLLSSSSSSSSFSVWWQKSLSPAFHSPEGRSSRSGSSGSSSDECFSAADPLTCYLQSVVLSLPDICSSDDDNENDDNAVCIVDFVCTGILLESIPSSYAGAPSTSLTLGLTGLGTSCSGTVEYSRSTAAAAETTIEFSSSTSSLPAPTRRPRLSSTFTAVINSTDINTTLIVVPEPLSSSTSSLHRAGAEATTSETKTEVEVEYPVAVESTACAMSSIYVDVHFADKSLDSLRAAVDGLIERAAAMFVCDMLVPGLAANLTTLLEETVDPVLLFLVQNTTADTATPASYAPSTGDPYVVWGNTIIGTMHSIVNRFRMTSSSDSGSESLLSCMVPLLFSQGRLELDLVRGVGGYRTSRKTGTSTLRPREYIDRKGKPVNVILQFREEGQEEKEEEKEGRTNNKSSSSKASSKTSSRSDRGSDSWRKNVDTETIPTYSTTTTTTTTSFSIEPLSLQLTGLDTVSGLSLLTPLPANTSNVTLRSTVNFESLGLYATLQVLVKHIDEDISGDSGEYYQSAGEGEESSLLLYNETVELKVLFSSVSATIDLLVAVDNYLLQNLYFDQLGMEAGIGCWIYVLDELSIPNLDIKVTVDELSISQLEGSAGSLEGDMVTLINNAIALGVDGFPELVSGVVTGALQGPVRQQINAAIAHALLVAEESHPCVSHFPHAHDEPQDYIHWANSSLIQLVDSLINEVIGPTGLNNIINCLTGGTGSVVIEDLLTRVRLDIGGLNTFSVLSVLTPQSQSKSQPPSPYTNADTDTDISFSPFSLYSELELGTCSSSISSTSSSTSSSSSSKNNNITNSAPEKYVDMDTADLDCPLTITMSTTSALNAALLLIQEDKRHANDVARETIQFLVSDTLDRRLRNTRHGYGENAKEEEEAAAASQPSSLSSGAPYIRYAGSDVEQRVVLGHSSTADDVFYANNDEEDDDEENEEIGSITLSLNSLHFALDILAQVDKDSLRDLKFSQKNVAGCLASTAKQMAVAAVAASVMSSSLDVHPPANSGDTRFDFTAVVNEVLTAVFSSERVAAFNTDLAEQLSVSAETCENGGVSPFSSDDTHSPHSSSSSLESWYKSSSPVVFWPVVAALLVLFAASGSYTYRHRKEFRDRLFGGGSTKPVESSDMWKFWRCDEALVFDGTLPLWLRAGIPPILTGVFVLFVFCDYYNVATMVVQIEANGSSSDKFTIFEFGLAGTVNDLWDAKIYPLAILISFFSGGWPFLKLFLMLVAWVCPPFFMSVSSREQLLHFLDAVGKWSLLDVFVMLLFVSAFYCEFDLSAPDSNGGDGLKVFVAINPTWGFYGFLASTMSSLVLSHCMYFFHNLVCTTKRAKADKKAKVVRAPENICGQEDTTRKERGSRSRSSRRSGDAELGAEMGTEEEEEGNGTRSNSNSNMNSRLSSRESTAWISGKEYAALTPPPPPLPSLFSSSSTPASLPQDRKENEEILKQWQHYKDDEEKVDMDVNINIADMMRGDLDSVDISIDDNNNNNNRDRGWSFASAATAEGGTTATRGLFPWLSEYIQAFDMEEDKVEDSAEQQPGQRYQSLCESEFIISLPSSISGGPPGTSSSSSSSSSFVSSYNSSLSEEDGLVYWKVTLTAAGKVAVVLTLLTTLGLLAAGIYLLTMEFTFLGLVGLLLKKEASQKYSVITIGTLFAPHSRMMGSGGIWWTVVMFFLFCVGSPFLVLCIATSLWVLPMKYSTQRILLAVGEVVNAWSSLEVFVVAVLAALLQVQQFAAFIVGDSCDRINEFLENYLDSILDGDDKCLDVIAELTIDFWYMLCAAVLLMIVSYSTFHLVSVVLRQRMNSLFVDEQITIRKKNTTCHSSSSSLSKDRDISSAKDDGLFLPLLSDISESDLRMATSGEEERDEVEEVGVADPPCIRFNSVVSVILRVLRSIGLVNITS